MSKRHSCLNLYPCVIKFSQSVPQSVSQSLSQSVGLSVSLSVSQSVSESVSHSVSQSLCQSVSLSVSQSVSQSLNQSVSQSVSQSVNQSISQPASLSHLAQGLDVRPVQRVPASVRLDAAVRAGQARVPPSGGDPAQLAGTATTATAAGPDVGPLASRPGTGGGRAPGGGGGGEVGGGLRRLRQFHLRREAGGAGSRGPRASRRRPGPADAVAALTALLQLDSNPPVADVHSCETDREG